MNEYRIRSPSEKSRAKLIDTINTDELVELREAFRVFDQDGDVNNILFFVKSPLVYL